MAINFDKFQHAIPAQHYDLSRSLRKYMDNAVRRVTSLDELKSLEDTDGSFHLKYNQECKWFEVWTADGLAAMAMCIAQFCHEPLERWTHHCHRHSDWKYETWEADPPAVNNQSALEECEDGECHLEEADGHKGVVLENVADLSAEQSSEDWTKNSADWPNVRREVRRDKGAALASEPSQQDDHREDGHSGDKDNEFVMNVRPSDSSSLSMHSDQSSTNSMVPDFSYCIAVDPSTLGRSTAQSSSACQSLDGQEIHRPVEPLGGTEPAPSADLAELGPLAPSAMHVSHSPSVQSSNGDIVVLESPDDTGNDFDENGVRRLIRLTMMRALGSEIASRNSLTDDQY